MACKEGQLDVVELFRTFSINLNAQHENEMTSFDVRLLDNAVMQAIILHFKMCIDQDNKALPIDSLIHL